MFLDRFSEIHNLCMMDDLHRDLPFTFVFKISQSEKNIVPISHDNLQVPSSGDCKLSEHLLFLAGSCFDENEFVTVFYFLLYFEDGYIQKRCSGGCERGRGFKLNLFTLIMIGVHGSSCKTLKH